MALAVTVTKHWEDTKILHVLGSIVPSGSYSTNGDTLNFSIASIKSASSPLFVHFNKLSKYLLSFSVGTTIANGKMKVTVPDTGLELGAGAYPVALTGDTITFHAMFLKNQ